MLLRGAGPRFANAGDLMIDDTHDPGRKSWVKSANQPGCDFPIQNLPLGTFRWEGDCQRRVGVAIGDFILDAVPWIPGGTLDHYLALSANERCDVRRDISKVLEAGANKLDLYPQAECSMLLPAPVGDYTDFYAS